MAFVTPSLSASQYTRVGSSSTAVGAGAGGGFFEAAGAHVASEVTGVTAAAVAPRPIAWRNLRLFIREPLNDEAAVEVRHLVARFDGVELHAIDHPGPAEAHHIPHHGPSLRINGQPRLQPEGAGHGDEVEQ